MAKSPQPANGVLAVAVTPLLALGAELSVSGTSGSTASLSGSSRSLPMSRTSLLGRRTLFCWLRGRRNGSLRYRRALRDGTLSGLAKSLASCGLLHRVPFHGHDDATGWCVCARAHSS